MKIYEHCLYCDLYDIENSGEDYSQVKFGEDFCLSDNEDIGGHRFYIGTHIIEVISDKEYMRQLLKKVEKASEVMSDIVVNDGPSDFFKALFISDKKIDSLDVYNCHSLLQKILLEKEVVPKVLALKYIMSYLDGTKHKKEEYKTIYPPRDDCRQLYPLVLWVQRYPSEHRWIVKYADLVQFLLVHRGLRMQGFSQSPAPFLASILPYF